MALSGLQIYKLLPQTNCKVCGLPTCFAFASKVTVGEAAAEACTPLFDDEQYAQKRQDLLAMLAEAAL